MTTLCRIVLAVVTCTADSETPKPSPTEAVAILKAGGTRLFIPDQPKPWEAGYPYFDFENRPLADTFPSWAPSERRPDATSLYDPPIVYGAVPFYGYRRHAFGGANHIVPGSYYGPPLVHRYRERIHHEPGRVDREPGEATSAGSGGRGARGPAPRRDDRRGTRAGVGGIRVTRPSIRARL
jgi:hypothetical protein